LADKTDANSDAKAESRPGARPTGAVNSKPGTGGAVAAKMTVTGRVVDAQGKAVANARVAVVGLAESAMRVHPLDSVPQILAEGRADAKGQFRLTAPQTSRKTYWEVYLLAGASGHGLATASLDADAKQPTAKVTLAREHIIRGRLVDLQGTPARK